MIQIRSLILSALTLMGISSHARLAEVVAPLGQERLDIVAEIFTAHSDKDQAGSLDESGWDGYVDQYDASTLRDDQVASSAVQMELPRPQSRESSKARPMELPKPSAMIPPKPSQKEATESSVTLRCHQTGVASWYGGRAGGEKTANGERLDGNAMTAANKTLPFGTMVRVTNRKNGRSIVVRINDRGPYISGRIIDLSYAAKNAIGMDGIDAVQLECI